MAGYDGQAQTTSLGEYRHPPGDGGDGDKKEQPGGVSTQRDTHTRQQDEVQGGSRGMKG